MAGASVGGSPRRARRRRASGSPRSSSSSPAPPPWAVALLEKVSCIDVRLQDLFDAVETLPALMESLLAGAVAVHLAKEHGGAAAPDGSAPPVALPTVPEGDERAPATPPRRPRCWSPPRTPEWLVAGAQDGEGSEGFFDALLVPPFPLTGADGPLGPPASLDALLVPPFPGAGGPPGPCSSIDFDVDDVVSSIFDMPVSPAANAAASIEPDEVQLNMVKGVIESEDLPFNISHVPQLQNAVEYVSEVGHLLEQFQMLHELQPDDAEPSDAEVAIVAAAMGYTSALENLGARREAAGASSCKLLRALVATNGLVNKAKRLLHSAK